MGGQRQYRREIGGYEIPTGARLVMDEAVEQILAHVAETGSAGIYAGDGTWRGEIDGQVLAPMLEGPARVRRGERTDGKDTIVDVTPDDSFGDTQDRIYQSRHYASPRLSPV
ncbi:hypothetical protein [Actinopolymorpha alba]|uniref:hypothetical protein n=1 Tax=Actinopolymorpha alba TaxID=533267 RepID=UPI0003757B1E|nr:hypothetical protein [Actinopolymorpha alba]